MLSQLYHERKHARVREREREREREKRQDAMIIIRGQFFMKINGQNRKEREREREGKRERLYFSFVL